VAIKEQLEGRDEAAVEWLLKARAANHRRPHLAQAALAVAYAGLGREDEGRALMAEHLARAPWLTLSDVTDGLSHHGAAVAPQRARIDALLGGSACPRAASGRAPPVRHLRTCRGIDR
jgi:hypothetical protein